MATTVELLERLFAAARDHGEDAVRDLLSAADYPLRPMALLLGLTREARRKTVPVDSLVAEVMYRAFRNDVFHPTSPQRGEPRRQGPRRR